MAQGGYLSAVKRQKLFSEVFCRWVVYLLAQWSRYGSRDSLQIWNPGLTLRFLTRHHPRWRASTRLGWSQYVQCRWHAYDWFTICNKMPGILPGFSLECSCASTETVCSASLRKFHALPVVTAPYTHGTAFCSRSLNSLAAIMVAMHCGNPAFRLSFFASTTTMMGASMKSCCGERDTKKSHTPLKPSSGATVNSMPENTLI